MKSKLLLSLSLSFQLTHTSSGETYNPYWWNEFKGDGTIGGYGVLDTSKSPLDSGVATIGQLKHMVSKTKLYLDDYLAGAGESVNSLIEKQFNPVTNNHQWFISTTNNHDVLRVGQLKWVAGIIYERIADAYPNLGAKTSNWDISDWDTGWLVSEGFDYVDPSTYTSPPWNTVTPNVWKKIANNYGKPWTHSTGDDEDSGVVTVGQLKKVFSFEFPEYTAGLWDHSRWIETYGGQTTALGETATLQRGTYVARRFYPFDRVPGSPWTSIVQELYSPTLAPGEKAPLYILFSGTAFGGHSGLRWMNQIVMRYFCMTGEFRAHYMHINSVAGISNGYGSTFEPLGSLTDSLSSQIIEKVISDDIKDNNGNTIISTNVDLDRVYLVGYSEGTRAAINLMAQQPTRYAGALMTGFASVRLHANKSEADRLALINHIGHIPMALIRGESENEPGVRTHAEYEDVLTKIKTAFPDSESFIAQMPGNHSGAQNSTMNQLEFLVWLSRQKRN